MLSPQEKRNIETRFAHYPDRRALCIEALKVVQRQRGWVSDECLRDIADLLDVAPQALAEVAARCTGIRRAAI